MAKLKSFFLLVTCILVTSCSPKQGFYQTADFRHFIRDFFQSEDYQKRHIKFPVQISYYEYSEYEEDSQLTTKYIDTGDWVFFEAPIQFQCEMNCFDLVIYDNFNKKQKASNERVLSYQGVHNGINSSLFFKLIDGTWYLVKYEQFDN